ncbi:putative phosphoketolase domain protein [Brucella lupini]|uniref:Putative phosphoketolase domain protein n=1 Tax=Brucella lupini TaxID=255457 RepID=A0A256GI51_9HYPH|nr:putative phosphoketolase domain protein [Brucella lupini]
MRGGSSGATAVNAHPKSRLRIIRTVFAMSILIRFSQPTVLSFLLIMAILI